MKPSYQQNILKYLTFFRIQFSGGLQYRAAAFGGMVTQFAWGCMNILLFKAFYSENSSAFPMTFEALTSYIWLQQAFLALFMLWFWDREIFNMIKNGDVAYELVRPLSLYHMWFTKHAANRFVKTCLRCIPILIFGFLLPSPYGISLPGDAVSFVLFLLTLFLGFIVVCSFCMLIYIATFYTLNPAGVAILVLSMTELLTGAIIPLPFFPESVRKIIEVTPFAAMQNLPFRIYSGDIYGSEILKGILLQIFWLVVLITFGKWWMKRTLRKVIVQGG